MQVATITLAVVAVLLETVFVAMHAAGLGSKIDALGETMRDAMTALVGREDALDGRVPKLEGRIDEISCNRRGIRRDHHDAEIAWRKAGLPRIVIVDLALDLP